MNRYRSKIKFSKYRILSQQIYQVLFQQCCTISKLIEMKTHVKRIKLRDLPSKIIQSCSCFSSIFTTKYWHNNSLISNFFFGTILVYCRDNKIFRIQTAMWRFFIHLRLFVVEPFLLLKRCWRLMVDSAPPVSVLPK